MYGLLLPDFLDFLIIFKLAVPMDTIIQIIIDPASSFAKGFDAHRPSALATCNLVSSLLFFSFLSLFSPRFITHCRLALPVQSAPVPRAMRSRSCSSPDPYCAKNCTQLTQLKHAIIMANTSSDSCDLNSGNMVLRQYVLWKNLGGILGTGRTVSSTFESMVIIDVYAQGTWPFLSA